jgi:hypothetical protein
VCSGVSPRNDTATNGDADCWATRLLSTVFPVPVEPVTTTNPKSFSCFVIVLTAFALGAVMNGCLGDADLISV